MVQYRLTVTRATMPCTGGTKPIESRYILRIRRGNETSEYPIAQTVLSIGRADDNQVVLKDETVSRQHAVLGWASGSPRITDLNSTGGTIVNGTLLQPQTPRALSTDDVVEIGGYTLTIEPPPSAQDTSVISGIPAAGSQTQDTSPRIAADIPAAPSSLQKPGKKRIGGLTSVIVILLIAAVGAGGWFLAPSLITRHNKAVEQVRTEFISELSSLNEEAVQRMEVEIADMDGSLAQTDLKLQQLQEVVNKAQAWVDLRSQEAETAGHSWTARATAEELDEMKNEQYKVTTLEGKATSSGQFSAIIKVTDLSAQIPTGLLAERVEDELTFLKSSLSLQKQAEQQLKDRSTSTLQNIVQAAPNWDINQVNGNSYSVSGSRLGWSGDLTTGTWSYNRDNGTASASDLNSLSLEKILKCEQ